MKQQSMYSLTMLKRWSCKSKDIPGIAQIKQLHVYDFDNTLFSSPLPNPQLWAGDTIGKFQNEHIFSNGGWWHDPSILAATGEGVEAEEPRAWKGWWNEVIVELVKLSIAQKDVLTILLTGRGETRFAELVNRIVNARGLDFDLVVLKPDVGPQNQRFSVTMDFKQEFLRDVVFTYRFADEIRVYEDRPKHVKGFREYFERLNKSLLSHKIDEPPPPRKPIIADVIHVCEQNAILDMQTETLAIQNILNVHNASLGTADANSRAPSSRFYLKENFIYCGYLIKPSDSARLISLTKIPPAAIDSSEVRLIASNVLISPHKPSEQILKRAGGYGKKVTWQVIGVAKLDDRIWACKVATVPETEKVYTHDPTRIVVLACRKGTRPIDARNIQNWQPVPPEKAYVFETVVGDKTVLRLEEEGDDGGNGAVAQWMRNGNRFANGGQKRKWKERGSRSPENRGKENHQQVKQIQTNGERDDGTWIPANGPGRQSNHANNNNTGGGPGPGDRHGQARYFNNMNGSQNQNQNQGQNQNQKQNQNQNQQNHRNPRNQNNNNNNNGYNLRSNNNAQNTHGRNNNNNNSSSNNNNNNRGGGGGGGGRGRPGNRSNYSGPPGGYKSLDDYGPGGAGGVDFDGTMDTARGGLGGDVVMNY